MPLRWRAPPWRSRAIAGACAYIFKQAVTRNSDGHAFGPKPRKLNADTSAPLYVHKLALYKLLLLETEIHQAGGRPRLAERDLLYALRFLTHL